MFCRGKFNDSHVSDIHNTLENPRRFNKVSISPTLAERERTFKCKKELQNDQTTGLAKFK
jgi:hypothetical protein